MMDSQQQVEDLLDVIANAEANDFVTNNSTFVPAPPPPSTTTIVPPPSIVVQQVEEEDMNAKIERLCRLTETEAMLDGRINGFTVEILKLMASHVQK